MISRFHALLELACRESQGQVQLVNFIQGAALYNHVEVPALRFEPDPRPGEGQWVDGDGTETLPHRLDAFFTLRFLDRPDEAKQLAHFFYEADRKTMKSTDMKTKLRAHFHFSVKAQSHLALAGGRHPAQPQRSIDSNFSHAFAACGFPE